MFPSFPIAAFDICIVLAVVFQPFTLISTVILPMISINTASNNGSRFIQGGFFRFASGADVPDSSVYILSLPAFRWFKVPDPSSEPRGFHTCNAAGNSQLIVIGGFDFSLSEYALMSPPDPWKQQINVFDMSSLQWKDKYESRAEPYHPPEPVTQYYNQS